MCSGWQDVNIESSKWKSINFQGSNGDKLQLLSNVTVGEALKWLQVQKEKHSRWSQWLSSEETEWRNDKEVEKGEKKIQSTLTINIHSVKVSRWNKRVFSSQETTIVVMCDWATSLNKEPLVVTLNRSWVAFSVSWTMNERQVKWIGWRSGVFEQIEWKVKKKNQNQMTLTS